MTTLQEYTLVATDPELWRQYGANQSEQEIKKMLADPEYWVMAQGDGDAFAEFIQNYHKSHCVYDCARQCNNCNQCSCLCFCELA